MLAAVGQVSGQLRLPRHFVMNYPLFRHEYPCVSLPVSGCFWHVKTQPSCTCSAGNVALS